MLDIVSPALGPVLKKHDIVPRDRREAGPARGVLSAARPDGTSEHHRVLPCAAVAPFVAHFWAVRWALASPFAAETLPHPTVHIVFEEGTAGRRAEVGGVSRTRFARSLLAEGRVFAVKLRAGVFRALWGEPMASLTGRVVPVAKVFGRDGNAWANAVFTEETLEGRITTSEAFLAARMPRLPDDVRDVRDLVERMERDRTILRVDDAARLAGVTVRSLQRAFPEHVGVSPKWVLRCYRMHEAALRLAEPSAPTLAGLALSLGYADQAHFTRDFKATMGVTPSAFAGTRRDTPPVTAPRRSPNR